MKNEYKIKEEIQKKYSNRRVGLKAAQIANGVIGLGGTMASLGALSESWDAKYLAAAAVAAGGSYAIHKGLDYVKTKVNPRREAKDLENAVEKSTLDTHKKSGVNLEVVRA